MRIVARLLDNGKIEFGMQQVLHDNTWSDRVFPRARLFPADHSGWPLAAELRYHPQRG